MYAKCGALRQEQSVLEKVPSRNVVSWNALIVGYAQNGQGQQDLDCFEEELPSRSVLIAGHAQKGRGQQGLDSEREKGA